MNDKLRSPNSYYVTGKDISRKGAEYTIEFCIELEVGAAKTARRDLDSKGMILTWFFEKRRTEYRRSDLPIIVALDEIPEFGHYVEIEGPTSRSAAVEKALQPSLGEPETRNYKELFIALKEQQGSDVSSIKGAAFQRRSRER